jgi:hypothetical protein
MVNLFYLFHNGALAAYLILIHSFFLHPLL